MRYYEYLKKHLGHNENIPRGYHLIGHVALVTLSMSNDDTIEKIGELTLSYDPKVKSVAVKSGPTTGIVRQPSYTLIAGDTNTLTTHIENGVKFHIDPLRLTFSGGNRRERISFPERVMDCEHVVDLFSCVGQFGLHIAVRTEAKVTAIEINPEAYKLLQENIILNDVQDRMKAVLGDCRDVHPSDAADRVIMGYLHDTIEYLPIALDTLSPNGGWIHLHASIPKMDLIPYCNTIDTLSSEFSYHSKVIPRKIKHYSPGVIHYVFDIELSKTKA